MGRVEAMTMERRSWRNFAREERELVGIKCLSTVKPRYKDTRYKDILDIRIHLLAPQGLILLCATPRYKDTLVYP
jgi:hypothetical protein